MSEAPEPILLKDYAPYPFNVRETRLHVDIHPGKTHVTSSIDIQRQDTSGEDASRELVLDGKELELQSVAIDGRELGGNEYRVDDEQLVIFDVPDECVVTVRNAIVPEDNTALMGLYKSRTMYCTQCEAEGFRKITYYPDRPDVLSAFTTTITADAEQYPVLLSNGNPIEDRTEDGRRTVTWQDPFPKPSYLFALVAGDLAQMTDTFTTMSGRAVDLRIYSEPHNIDQCGYAMQALKRSMAWDEERFGREYDLDIFMIVAVEDFNMGAMENKGLNIFNTSCVLASPDTATDAAYQRVEGVVAHEYFHNWSGNRVTCRDWFQLSLKEGFTVYRDAEFSSDMNSRTIKRVEDVEFLRSIQFVEDAGPLAHPVRPDSYMEISNFYTTTVYEKGAEVVRMLATILGAERFRAGCDLYFDRHDGQAVTTEDFVAAMEHAAGERLATFRNWYSQVGTPKVSVTQEREGDRLTLHLKQECAPSPGQPNKEPFHIPLALGIVDGQGREVLGAQGAANGFSVEVQAEVDIGNPNADGTLIAHFSELETHIAFQGIPDDAEVSFLRGFSAPVNVDYPRPAKSLLFLAAHDTDGFARWDAAQEVIGNAILDAVRGTRDFSALHELFEGLFDEAMAAEEGPEHKALLAAMMTLPRTSYLLDRAPGTDIFAIEEAREALKDELAAAFPWDELIAANEQHADYVPEGAHIARRDLLAVARHYRTRHLDRTDPDQARKLREQQLANADNLTDRLDAFSGLLELESLDDAAKQQHADAFYARWSDEALVVDTWFSRQAISRWGTLDLIARLEQHEAFNIKNPNKVRSLYGAFLGNIQGFHAADGSGYDWLVGKVLELDALNPSVASRLAKTLTQWKRYDKARATKMRAALKRILDNGDLSKDVLEVATKGLED